MGDGPGHVKPGEAGHDPEAVAARGSPSSTTRAASSASRTPNGSATATPAWRSGSSRTTPRRSATCRSTSARQRLVDLFEQYRPDVVITYADNGGYNHPDHVHAHRITVAAVERSTVPAKLYLIARRRRDWQAMRERLDRARRGVPAAPAAEPRTTRADGAASKSRSPRRSTCAPVADRKRDALAAHGSQLDESWWSKIPPDLWSDIFGEESFIRVHDTTGAAVPETDLFAGPALIDGCEPARARGAHPAATDRDARASGRRPKVPSGSASCPPASRGSIDRWELELGPPYLPGGVTSYVAPARRADGSPRGAQGRDPAPRSARRSRRAAVWAGNGAVALLDSVREEHALLLEHCDPGTRTRRSRRSRRDPRHGRRRAVPAVGTRPRRRSRSSRSRR